MEFSKVDITTGKELPGAQMQVTYKEACKEMGFTKDASSWEGNYDADDENGYSLSVTYDEDEHSMSVRITAAED